MASGAARGREQRGCCLGEDGREGAAPEPSGVPSLFYLHIQSNDSLTPFRAVRSNESRPIFLEK